MTVKGIIIDFDDFAPGNHGFWKNAIREGWEKCEVVADDALFAEAFLYGEKELRRVLPILHFRYEDINLQRIKLELEYLASNGHFPPSSIDEKAKEIYSLCMQNAMDRLKEVKPEWEKLTVKYPIVVISEFYDTSESILQSAGFFKDVKRIINFDESKDTKESPLATAISSIGYPADEIMIIGNSENKTLRSARELGCNPIVLSSDDVENETPLTPDEWNCIKTVAGFFEGIVEG